MVVRVRCADGTFGSDSSGSQTLRNTVRDLRYGAFLGGMTRTRAMSTSGAHDVVNSDYGDLKQIVRQCKADPR